MQPLAQEFPSGLMKLYLILSYLVLSFQGPRDPITDPGSTGERENTGMVPTSTLLTFPLLGRREERRTLVPWQMAPNSNCHWLVVRAALRSTTRTSSRTVSRRCHMNVHSTDNDEGVYGEFLFYSNR